MGKKKTVNQFADLAHQKIIIYCAGSLGHSIFNLITKKCSGAGVFAFCDTHKTGFDEKTGLRILPLNELALHKDAVIVIGLMECLKANEVLNIEEKLLAEGFANEQIMRYSEFAALYEGLASDEFDWQKFSDDLYDFDTNLLLIEKMAEWIDQGDKSVVDLGAGKMNLKRFLLEDVKYYPVDYKQRFPETIVCDFNKNEFPDVYADVYFLCAMLYYIEDPSALLEKTAHFANKKIIIGVSNADFKEYKAIMHIAGVKSYMYIDEIQQCLSKVGFALAKSEVIESVGRRYVMFERVEAICE